MRNSRDHLDLIKLLNRSNVLKVIKEEGPISRVDLAARTGLSRPTISSIVEELIRADLVREIGKGPSCGGKRPILLEFNAKAYYIIGALFEGTTLSGVITDLEGQVLLKDSIDILYTSGDKVVDKVIEFLKSLCEKGGISENELLGIGIGLPGVIDKEKATISLAPSVGWINKFPIKKVLEETFNLPVIIENDVNTVALGEMWKGAGKESKNLVVFHVGTGIGAGIVINGKLYRGSSGAAGEIGHLPIGRGERNLGEFGIYEKNWACPALKKFLRENFPDLDSEALKFPVKTLREISKINGKAESYLKDACIHWAYGIASIVCVLNTDLVILAGHLTYLGEVELDIIRKRLDSWIPFAPKVEIASLGELAGNIGAALSVLHSEEDTIIESIL